MASTTSSNGDTGYVYGGPASNLASEIRSIAFAPSALQGINSFIDQVLLSTLSNLPPAPAPAPASIISGPAASIALPLTTRAFKDALLAAFHGNTTFVRDAILEAELEQRDWVKSRGRSSDLALPPLSPSKRRPSVANQIPFVEKGPATYELKKQELQTCTVQDLFFELQTAIYQLSTLGHRAAFPHTPGSGAAAASNLKNRGYLTLLSPLLALYTSSVVNYLAAYLVKGCTKTVESIPDLSVADLSQFVEFMEEDALLNDLWKTIVSIALFISLFISIIRTSHRPYSNVWAFGSSHFFRLLPITDLVLDFTFLVTIANEIILRAGVARLWQFRPSDVPNFT